MVPATMGKEGEIGERMELMDCEEEMECLQTKSKKQPRRWKRWEDSQKRKKAASKMGMEQASIIQSMKLEGSLLEMEQKVSSGGQKRKSKDLGKEKNRVDKMESK